MLLLLLLFKMMRLLREGGRKSASRYHRPRWGWPLVPPCTSVCGRTPHTSGDSQPASSAHSAQVKTNHVTSRTADWNCMAAINEEKTTKIFWGFMWKWFLNEILYCSDRIIVLSLLVCFWEHSLDYL
jgi:hypothetical protein